MSSDTQLHTIVVPWRKVCAALPLLALVASPVLFVPQTGPSPDLNSAPVSSDSPVVVVPDVALSLPAPRRIAPDRLLGEAAPKAPSSPKGKVVGGADSAPAILDSTGIPVRALEGYRAAAKLVNASDPGCHIDWALLAAIGRVESNHARFAGNQLDSAGTARPGIIGLPLNGSSGVALIPDSDGGALDRDAAYDRAVGPMQFIPSTWRVVGTDANGDGVKDPQNMSDSATASAIYLCSGPGDLSRPDDLHAAILRYNASDAYADMVTGIAASYRLGVSALPASDVAPASAAPAKPAAAKPAKKASKPAVASAPAAKAAGQQPAGTTAPKATIPPTSALTQPKPASATTVPPTTMTPTTVPPTTVPPTTTTPTTLTPTTMMPTTVTPSTTQPTNCLPTSTATPTTSTATPTTSTASPTTAPTPCVTQTAGTSTSVTPPV